MKGADAVVIWVPGQAVQSMVGREVGFSILDSMRLRKASIKYGSFLPELGIDVFEHIKLVDYGDLCSTFPNTAESLFEHFKLIDEKVGEVLDVGAIPITIGGFPYAIAKAIANKTNGKVGIVFLDAHGDNLEEHRGDKWSGACWVARTAEIENVDMTNFVQIGMRGPRNFKEQVEWFKEKGCHLYIYWEIKKKEMDTVVKEALTYAKNGTDRLFLNVDFDVLDLGTAPGLDEPLGITTAELLTLMYEIGKSGVTGFNVEWIPTPAWEGYHSPAMPLYWIVTWTVVYMLAGLSSGRLAR